MMWLSVTYKRTGETQDRRMRAGDAAAALRWWREDDSPIYHLSGFTPAGEAGEDAGPALVREQLLDLHVHE